MEARQGAAIPNLERVARRVRRDTFVVMRHSHNGQYYLPNPHVYVNSFNIRDWKLQNDEKKTDMRTQSKLHQAPGPLRLYGQPNGNDPRVTQVTPAAKSSVDARDRCYHRAMAADRRVPVPRTQGVSPTAMARVPQNRPAPNPPPILHLQRDVQE